MNRTIKIFLSILALFVLLILFFFRIADVPDIESGGNYDPTKKEMEGLWLFHQLLEETYGEEDVEWVRSDELNYLEEKSNTLLVMVRNNIGMDSSMRDAIRDFTFRGNEVLMAGKDFNLQTFDWYRDVGTGIHHDTVFSLGWLDGTTFTHRPYIMDSTFMIKRGIHYFYRNEGADTLDSDYNVPVSDFSDLAMIEDSLSFFRRMGGIDSLMYIHAVPELFVNISSKSDAFFTHFNQTFSHFSSDKVILHTFIRNNILAGTNQDSFLKYILSQKALKYAYYLLILLCLTYVFFSSKRKQKSIPIVPPVKNTSLEYIHTISNLFKAQDQNEKLVPHMKRVFYHDIRKKYFLDPEHSDFTIKLSRKSKVPVETVESIINQLKIADHYSYNDDQLIRLYNDIHSFKKNSS